MREKEKDIQEAAEFFGCKSNLAKSSLIDVSIISELPADVHSVLDVITSYGNEIYESKFER